MKNQTKPQDPTEAPAMVQEGALAESLNRAENMNRMALRIWDAQSVSLPLADRTRRIKAALLLQGYVDEDMAVLQLPVAGFERYL